MQFQVLISGLLLLLPAAVDSFPEVHGEVGHPVTLPCTYPVSSGLSSMCWGQGACASDTCGHTLIWTDGYRIYYRTTNRYQLKGQLLQGNVSLTIENATESDSGLYCCRVEMKGWSDVQRWTISLQVQAGVPTSYSRGLTITSSFKSTKRPRRTPRKIIITPRRPITIPQRRPPTTPRRPPSTPRRPPTTPRRPPSTPKRPPTTPRRPPTTPRRPPSTPRRPPSTPRRPPTTPRRPPTTPRRPPTTPRRPPTTPRRPPSTPRRPPTTPRRPPTTPRRPPTPTRRPTTATSRPITTTRRPTTATSRPITTTRGPSITTRRLTNVPIPTRIYASTLPLPVYTQTRKPVYTTILTSSHHPWSIHTKVVPTPNPLKISTKGLYIGISVSAVLLILMSILMIIKCRHMRKKKSETKSPSSSVVFHAYPNEAFQSTTQIQAEDKFTDDSFYANIAS